MMMKIFIRHWKEQGNKLLKSKRQKHLVLKQLLSLPPPLCAVKLQMIRTLKLESLEKKLSSLRWKSFSQLSILLKKFNRLIMKMFSWTKMNRQELLMKNKRTRLVDGWKFKTVVKMKTLLMRIRSRQFLMKPYMRLLLGKDYPVP